jgi:predicted dehydrogenase
MERSQAGCLNVFYDPADAVGGALSDLGCHPVYLTQLFLGARPATVSATYASFTKRQVEDQAVVTLGYPGGAIGVIETGFLSRDPFTIKMRGT